MGEAPHRIAEEIGQVRAHIDNDLVALRRRARKEAGWAVDFWEHPLWIAGTVLAVAFTLGFLIGKVTSRG